MRRGVPETLRLNWFSGRALPESACRGLHKAAPTLRRRRRGSSGRQIFRFEQLHCVPHNIGWHGRGRRGDRRVPARERARGSWQFVHGSNRVPMKCLSASPGRSYSRSFCTRKPNLDRRARSWHRGWRRRALARMRNPANRRSIDSGQRGFPVRRLPSSRRRPERNVCWVFEDFHHVVTGAGAEKIERNLQTLGSRPAEPGTNDLEIHSCATSVVPVRSSFVTSY